MNRIRLEKTVLRAVRYSHQIDGNLADWCVVILANSELDADRDDADSINNWETHMLVMSRKANESIVVNDNIIVTVVDIRGDKVRLGVQAPDGASVHRSEVYLDDDPYPTVVHSPKAPPSEMFDTVQIPSLKHPAATLQIDREHPLHSLKTHLLAILGEQQFNQVRPLLDQLGESRSISVK